MITSKILQQVGFASIIIIINVGMFFWYSNPLPPPVETAKFITDTRCLIDANDNVVISAYLGERIDQQHKFNVPRDDINYLSRYYNSVKKLGLRTVILHDSKISEKFARKYTTDRITFHRVDLKDESYDKFGVYNLRFEIFLRYLEQNPHKYVMISDLRDVDYKGNVFEWMEASRDYYDLYVGSENVTLDSWNWEWIRWTGNDCYEEFYKTHKNITGPVLYNVGLIGGHHERVKQVLTRMRELFLESGVDKMCDTAAFFRILYYETNLTRVNSGYPLHTTFDQPDSRFAYISHK